MLDKQSGQADGPVADKRVEKVGQRETSSSGGGTREGGRRVPGEGGRGEGGDGGETRSAETAVFLQEVGVCQRDLLRLDGSSDRGGEQVRMWLH